MWTVMAWSWPNDHLPPKLSTLEAGRTWGFSPQGPLLPQYPGEALSRDYALFTIAPPTPRAGLAH